MEAGEGLESRRYYTVWRSVQWEVKEGRGTCAEMTTLLSLLSWSQSVLRLRALYLEGLLGEDQGPEPRKSIPLLYSILCTSLIFLHFPQQSL